jgi:hypothetical protein
MPSLNRVVFLVTAMVCLPPVSFTYTLVHLYVPILLLMGNFATSHIKPPVTAILSLLLLLSLTLPLVSLSVIQPTPTGPIQAFTLLAVLILSVLTPWPDIASTL